MLDFNFDYQLYNLLKNDCYEIRENKCLVRNVFFGREDAVIVVPMELAKIAKQLDFEGFIGHFKENISKYVVVGE